MNNLRHKVRLRTDGGIKTGRDIVIASILGAEEYGVGTTSLVAMGCILVRQCHSDVCPVGLCTQRPELIKKFEGTPEKVINLFSFIAQETREILASLGIKSINEIIGRTDLLRQVNKGCKNVDGLDLNSLLVKAVSKNPIYNTVVKRNEVLDTLDANIIKDIKNNLHKKNAFSLKYNIKNTDRAVGARLSSFLISNLKKSQIAQKKFKIYLKGSAGQSIGAFMIKQIQIEICGDANDYVGKGLSGGTIIIKPEKIEGFLPQDNTILGNTVLYGATSGSLFANGISGERFAVRNSGANAVVEGCGNNGCEYMTGGKIIILGKVGDNFASGMTGGMAFIYDPNNVFKNFVNNDTVIFQKIVIPYWEEILISFIKQHLKFTGSNLAKFILNNWQKEKSNFLQVVPLEILDKLEHPISSRHKKEIEKKLA